MAIDITNIRQALSSVALGLSWDEMSQHPITLSEPVSWLQLTGATTYTNKPSEYTLGCRVMIWETSLEAAETYAIAVSDYVGRLGVDLCLTGASRATVSNIQIGYAGQAQDGSNSNLFSYTLTLSFNITLTATL